MQHGLKTTSEVKNGLSSIHKKMHRHVFKLWGSLEAIKTKSFPGQPQRKMELKWAQARAQTTKQRGGGT